MATMAISFAISLIVISYKFEKNHNAKLESLFELSGRYFEL